MRAKEYLSQFGRYEDRIQRKLIDVYRSRVLATNITVAFGERVQTSGTGDRISGLVASIVDTERAVEDLLQAYRDFSDEALWRLENMCLSGDAGMNEYKVLHARFVQRLTFEDIAEALNYSERQVYNLYKDGLTDFERLYLT